MRGDLTTYAGRAKRRPPGASDFTQQLYRLLYQHPEGLTRDEIHTALAPGWMETDAYRAYERHLMGRSQRHHVAKQSASPSQHGGVVKQCSVGRQHDHEWRRRAQLWFIGYKLTHMRRLGIAQRKGDQWFAGRPPRVRSMVAKTEPKYVTFDPEASQAVLTTTTNAHIERENAKAELLALLNDRTIKNTRAKEHVQAAYDWLCGRKQH